MDNQPQSPYQERVTTAGSAPSHTGRNVLLTLFVLLALAGAAVGGYFFGQSRTSTPQSQAPAATNTSADTHFVLARGYPFSTDITVETRLGVPAAYQAVLVGSTAGDPGLTAEFTNQSNDELGRWALGYPQKADSRSDSISLLSIHADWLAKTHAGIHQYQMGTQVYALNTPAQKKAFVDKVKADSAACKDDAAKGFVMDKLAVCYEVAAPRQSQGSYAPILTLYGYGELDSQPVLLLGQVLLRDDKEYTAEEQQAFLDSTELAEYAVKVKDTFVASLKQSTISVTKR